MERDDDQARSGCTAGSSDDGSPSRVAYVGTRTSRARRGRGKGLSTWLAPARGRWTQIQNLTADDGGEGPFDLAQNPTYLLRSDDGGMLYVAHGDTTVISWLRIDPDSGALSPSGSIDVGHRNPVDLCQVGRWLIVSCLGAPGCVMTLPIGFDGAPGPAASVFCPRGELGPHRERQRGANPHQAVLDPEGRRVLVCDRAHDTVWILDLDPETGALHEHSHLRLRRGEGPRHLAFHPSGKWAYVVTELRSNLVACRWDAESGTLKSMQILPVAPPDLVLDTYAAEVAVTPDGRDVVVANRSGKGDEYPPGSPDPDLLSVYRVLDDGTLHAEARVPTSGHRPRFFTITEDGRDVVVALEHSGEISIQEMRGAGLGAPRVVAEVGSPTCVAWGQRRSGCSSAPRKLPRTTGRE